MNPLRQIDKLLNGITMYRLVLYGLIALLTVATVFGFTGVLSLPGTGILASMAVLLVACYLTNKSLSYLYRGTVNSESYLITALILACILPPSTTAVRLGYVALAGIIATASKFIVAYRRVHIFNPAAFAAVVISLLGLMSITWWIGNPSMLPFVLVLGFLVVRKINQMRLALAFLITSILMLVLLSLVTDQSTIVLIKNAILSGPIIFFAAIMLTEPATMPSLHYYQLLYALLVGALYSSQLRLGVLSTSPHMVLLAGNIFAFAVSPKTKLMLRLKEKIKVAERVYDFVFTADRKFSFIPGQYMEWTLHHKHIDGRGNRRSFTIASSPTEKEVHMGVKFYLPSSSFKKALFAMKPGDSIAAGHITGDFILPRNPSTKLVFIAGGVGITPFRSILKYLTDSGQQRDITLFYHLSKREELAYEDVLQEAENTNGLRVRLLQEPAISSSVLNTELPDFKERTFYISGPNGFVESYRQQLTASGVHGSHIVTDYFSGY